MKKSEVLKIFLSVLILGIVYRYLDYNGTFDVLTDISVNEFLALVGLNFFTYIITGFQTNYMIKQHYGKGLSIPDILFLPFSMSLFAHIIPTNGGVIFSAFYLKSKYKIKASSGFSFGVVLIYISFLVTGSFGILTFFLFKNVSFFVLLLSFFLLTSPILVHFLNYFFQKIIFRKKNRLTKIQKFINELVLSSNNLMKDRKVVTVNILLTLIYLGLSYVTLYLINEYLNMEISGPGVFMILVITRVSSLIKILPGNLGVQELFFGGIFELIGSSTAMGLIFSLTCRLSILVLFIPLGIFHVTLNSNYLNLKKLRSQLKKQ